MFTADSSSHLRSGLLDRREKLAATIELVPNNRNLQQLLEEVDAALERLKAGRYGICEICDERIEGNQLQVDPLRRHCPSHLAPMERAGDSLELAEATRAVMNIQRRLLPNSEIPLGPWEFCFDYAPVGPVGGDYCDLVCGYDRDGHGKIAPPRDHFLFVGDVMGKGFAASKISSQLNGVLRTLLEFKLPMDEMLERANRIFCERVEVISYYATLVCVQASSAGTIDLVNAGHVPPLLLRSGGAERLMSSGLPLGLFYTSTYEVTHVQLTPGETLLLYTDGVTEARNGFDTEYGIERLARFAADKSYLAPKDLVRACRDDVSAFTSGTPPSDDLTLLALRHV